MQRFIAKTSNYCTKSFTEKEKKSEKSPSLPILKHRRKNYLRPGNEQSGTYYSARLSSSLLILR